MIDYTLDTEASDCEDCAILKYVALREAMVVGPTIGAANPAGQ
jgi:predicted transglutaminase-like cysteine proteinase